MVLYVNQNHTKWEIIKKKEKVLQHPNIELLVFETKFVNYTSFRNRPIWVVTWVVVIYYYHGIVCKHRACRT